MFFEALITFELIDNHIEHVITDFEIRLEERDQIFTIIRVGPDAVLQTFKADMLERSTHLLSKHFPALWNVKNEYPPLLVPLSRLR